jgi:hypothetical protein
VKEDVIIEPGLGLEPKINPRTDEKKVLNLDPISDLAGNFVSGVTISDDAAQARERRKALASKKISLQAPVQAPIQNKDIFEVLDTVKTFYPGTNLVFDSAFNAGGVPAMLAALNPSLGIKSVLAFEKDEKRAKDYLTKIGERKDFTIKTGDFAASAPWSFLNDTILPVLTLTKDEKSLSALANSIFNITKKVLLKVPKDAKLSALQDEFLFLKISKSTALFILLRSKK